MEKLIEHDVTTPPKHLYEQRRRGVANADAFDKEIVPLDGVPDALLDWARHIAGLATYIDAGAHLTLDDLQPAEWRGIAMWRAALASVRTRWRFCPQCSTALRDSKRCSWCGWRAESAK